MWRFYSRYISIFYKYFTIMYVFRFRMHVLNAVHYISPTWFDFGSPKFRISDLKLWISLMGLLIWKSIPVPSSRILFQTHPCLRGVSQILHIRILNIWLAIERYMYKYIYTFYCAVCMNHDDKYTNKNFFFIYLTNVLHNTMFERDRRSS